MSQKQVKQSKKDEAKDFADRRGGFLKESIALAQKYRVDVRPEISFTNLSEIQSLAEAKIVIVDMKDKYEQVVEGK